MSDDLDMSPILDRIIDGYEKVVWCESGWWPLLLELDSEMADIDPLYMIYQVKEKFGRIAYYYAPSQPNFYKQLQDLVSKFSSKIDATCEKTGKPGVLMRRDEPFGTFKTLCEDYEGNGWRVVKFS